MNEGMGGQADASSFPDSCGSGIIPSRPAARRAEMAAREPARPYHSSMNAELFSATTLLILVIDPFGNVPLVVAALKNVPPERHVRVVLRECAAAYVILVGFMLGGRTFLQWLHLSAESLTIAGGIILFLIAIRMVFPRPEGIFGDLPGGEPFLVPLAIPSIAGPSALATVMLMASRDPARIGSWLLALTVAMGATTILLALADRLQRWLGERVILAFERLMGLVLTALAVEMLLSGVRSFAGHLAK
jgi:small neutral amino acid transporter SnatA (MarC family)